MAFRFKKEFENQTVVLSSGLLIDKESIKTPFVQAALSTSVWFAYMLEFDGTKQEEAPAPSAQPAQKPAAPKRNRTPKAS